VAPVVTAGAAGAVAGSTWNSGRLATKSVSQFTSTMMPSFAPVWMYLVVRSVQPVRRGAARSARWGAAAGGARLDDALLGGAARLLLRRRETLLPKGLCRGVLQRSGRGAEQRAGLAAMAMGAAAGGGAEGRGRGRREERGDREE